MKKNQTYILIALAAVAVYYIYNRKGVTKGQDASEGAVALENSLNVRKPMRIDPIA
tara:strand:- start:12235 stop:12402 length:168 start_codon:yes stop_codon:yes gene_type:complete